MKFFSQSTSPHLFLKENISKLFLGWAAQVFTWIITWIRQIHLACLLWRFYYGGKGSQLPFGSQLLFPKRFCFQKSLTKNIANGHYLCYFINLNFHLNPTLTRLKFLNNPCHLLPMGPRPNSNTSCDTLLCSPLHPLCFAKPFAPFTPLIPNYLLMPTRHLVSPSFQLSRTDLTKDLYLLTRLRFSWILNCLRNAFSFLKLFLGPTFKL